jgi:hypothetical protein
MYVQNHSSGNCITDAIICRSGAVLTHFGQQKKNDSFCFLYASYPEYYMSKTKSTDPTDRCGRHSCYDEKIQVNEDITNH